MNMKKLLLAFSLCLVLVIVLFAFEQGLFTSLRQEDLYGSWLTDVPAAEQIEHSLADFGISYDVPDDLQMTYEFQYHADGTVTVSVEEASAQRIAEIETEAMRVGLPELIYAQYQSDMNYSREDTDAFLASQGLTMTQLVDLALAEVDFAGQYTSASMIYTQYYCVDDGILCYAASSVDLASGNYDMTVEPNLRGNTMILSNARDRDGLPFAGSGTIKYPLTLRKK